MKQEKVNKNFEPMIYNIPEIYIKYQEGATIKKCEGYFNTWDKWSSDLQLDFLPAEPLSVALFILYLIQKDASFALIEPACCAINLVTSCGLSSTLHFTGC